MLPPLGTATTKPNPFGTFPQRGLQYYAGDQEVVDVQFSRFVPNGKTYFYQSQSLS